MDQPALDQRLGTVGANPPCCSRTARSRIDHRYSRKRRRQAASTDIPQIKEGCRFRKLRPPEWLLLPNQNMIAVDDRNCLPFRPRAVRLLTSRDDQLSRLALVSSATFLICAIAALAPAVLVSRSSVASLSSPTGASARSI